MRSREGLRSQAVTRLARATKAIVAAPDKAPATSYVFMALLLGWWGGRLYSHFSADAKPEGWQHFAGDAGLFVAAMCCAPGFMRYFAGNATRAIDLYRSIRVARSGAKEDRAPENGGGSPPSGNGS
jgi:hypothetical protein